MGKKSIEFRASTTYCFDFSVLGAPTAEAARAKLDESAHFIVEAGKPMTMTWGLPGNKQIIGVYSKPPAAGELMPYCDILEDGAEVGLLDTGNTIQCQCLKGSCLSKIAQYPMGAESPKKIVKSKSYEMKGDIEKGLKAKDAFKKSPEGKQ